MVTISIDFCVANQLIQAGEDRITILEEHVRNGVALSDVAYAIAQTGRGVLALREACGLTDMTPEALEARQAVTVATNHDAMQGWSEAELRQAWGNR